MSPNDSFEPPPDQIAELSAACERAVAFKVGVALDGTSDTLSLLDHYVREARSEVATRPEALPLLQTMVGAYLGEVVRARWGGSWFLLGEPEGWRLDLRPVFLTFNPVGMAREALLGEPMDGWHAHLETDEEDRQEIERRLESLGPVDDESFYLPTTRYEVIELTVAVLHGHMTQRGLGDVVFKPEDYRK